MYVMRARRRDALACSIQACKQLATYLGYVLGCARQGPQCSRLQHPGLHATSNLLGCIYNSMGCVWAELGCVGGLPQIETHVICRSVARRARA